VRVTQTAPTPAEALAELLSGNLRFVEDRRAHPNQDSNRRAAGAAGQTPFALIFGCSDSRVAAEIIFDRGLGDLFIVRTAGHVVDNGVLGSIEFGAEVLNIPLIIVLGHDGCGAVRATMEAYSSGRIPSGAVRHVVELVTPSILSSAQSGAPTIDQAVAEHARQTMYQLPERSAAIARRIADGRCAVVAMEYTLVEGRVRILDHLGDVDPGPTT
jgi:carbonic anhydrase